MATVLLHDTGEPVVTFEGRKPLAYGKADRANPFFIACGRGVALV